MSIGGNMTDETEFSELRAEATEGFDLRARLQNRGLREGQITLHLDEETGELLGHAKDIRNQFGLVTERIQEGVLGEIDKLDPESPSYAADLKKLEKERDGLVAKLNATGLTIKLRAVPPVIAKGAKRKARESMKIKGKVDESQLEDFNEAYLAHLLSDTIVSITDNESGGVIGKQTYEQCRDLKDFLPDQQYGRLDNKLAEVQFRDAVDESVSSDSDF